MKERVSRLVIAPAETYLEDARLSSRDLFKEKIWEKNRKNKSKN